MPTGDVQGLVTGAAAANADWRYLVTSVDLGFLLGALTIRRRLVGRLSVRTKHEGARFESLEPRLYLSATSDGHLENTHLDVVDPVLTAADDKASVVIDNVESAVAWNMFTRPVATEELVKRRELVFIDPDVVDIEALVADLTAGDDLSLQVDVVILDGDSDGVLQITDTLAGYRNLDAVHIVSHGSDGAVPLGKATLDLQSVIEYADAITGWAEALTFEADLLLYGCDVTALQSGRLLVGILGDLTGADVAASTGATDSARLGGNWELEYIVGNIETDLAFSASVQSGWMSVLTATSSSGNFVINDNTADTQKNVDTVIQDNGSSVAVFDSLDDGRFEVVAKDDGGLESTPNVTAQIDVTEQNDVPTLTLLTSPVDTTNEDIQVEVSFANLTTAGDENDVDGTVDAFIVKSVSSGTTDFNPLDVDPLTDGKTPLELVFIDTNTEDVDQLVTDLLEQESNTRSFEIHLLDSTRSGIEQISEVLSGRSGINAIHLVSHGTEGQIKLGNLWLSIDNVDGYAGEVATWNDSLRDGADLLIYGCDLASSKDGRTLSEALGRLCDCDVAASTDATGHALLGGDWELEFAAGSIESSVAFGSEAQANWYSLLGPSGWQYRRQLTFDNSAQTETLTDFPVLVHLDDTNFDFSKAQNNGEDIRFYDANDTSPLKYEIESWDSVAEKADIWVRVPLIDGASSSDFIWIYYGNATATDGQDAENVWDSNFVMVQHLEETSQTAGSNNDHLDSTSNSNDGEAMNGLDMDAIGKIDGADDFDGTNDYVEVPDSASFDVIDLTISAWINMDSSGLFSSIAARGAFNSGYYSLYHDFGTPGFSTFDLTTQNLEGTTNLDGTGWHYLVGTWHDSTNTKVLYVDGVQENSDNPTGSIANDNEGIFFGRQGGTQFPSDGRIDEVRISNTARSADWIAAQYKSMSDTFITFGAEQGLPTLDLDADDSSGATGDDFQFAFTEGDLPTAIADADTDLVDIDSVAFDNVKLSIAGLQDGNSEQLLLDSDVFTLATNEAGKNTTGGLYHVVITTGAGTADVTITKQGGGTFTEAEAETLIKGIQYQHTDTNSPTDGDRLIDVTVNDGDSDSTPARTTINVDPVNDAPTLTLLSSPVDTTNEDTEVEVSFADLTTAGNENDVDGTVDSFIVKSVTTGTLKIGATPGSATTRAVSIVRRDRSPWNVRPRIHMVAPLCR